MQEPPDSAQFQYVEGQLRPTFAARLARFQTESDAVAAGAGDVGGTLDLHYGPHEREAFDFFAAQAPGAAVRGTVLYLHAGYWQSRDKSLFRFLAPVFTRRALNVALLNHPLCPTVTLAELTASVRRSVAAVAAQARRAGQHGDLLVAVGHSAGAQLALELALAAPDLQGRQAPPIDGVVAISGVYDLAPLLETTLNDRLRLDAATARAASPLHRAASACPALFIVGAAETPAFLRQSRAMHDAWRSAGNTAALLEVPLADHFGVLDALARWRGTLGAALDRLLAQAWQHRADRH